ncbi:MAG: methyl-accepting chemotaxis protein [Myxococcaceae bacterium]
MQRLGFRVYLLILLGVTSVAPVLAVSVWESSRWQRHHDAQADIHGLLASEAIARELSRRLEVATLEVESVAQQTERAGGLERAVVLPVVRSRRPQTRGLILLGVADAQTKQLAVNPEGKERRREGLGHVEEALRSSMTVISSAELAPEQTRPVLEIVTPIQGSGFAFGWMELPDLATLTDGVLLEAGAIVYLLDREGFPQLRSTSAFSHPLLSLAGVHAAGDKSRLVSVLDASGSPLRSASATISQRTLGWRVVVAWPPIQSSMAATSRYAGLLAGGLVLLLGVLAALLLSTWLTRPLERIVEVTAAVGNRDLTQRLGEPGWWLPREAHDLVTRFRTMSTQLRGLLRSLRHSKDDIAKTIIGMSSMLRSQQSFMARQNAQLSELNVTARDVRDMASASASRAIEVLARTSNVDELRAAGEKSVEHSLQGLKEIKAQTQAIIATIYALLERTLEVSEITERVKDVADQSNVVALNAAIQAMRAGEFGRGFETVAEQMRVLSNRSIESTVRIREILSNTEKAIRDTASITEDGGRRIQHGMEQIQESGNRLRELSVIVEENSVGSNEIADAAQQQYTGLIDIAQALELLDEAMRDTEGVFDSADKLTGGLIAAAQRVSNQVDAFRVE